MAIAFVNKTSANSNATSVSSIASPTYSPAAGNGLIIVGSNVFNVNVTSLTLSTTTGNTINGATNGQVHGYFNSSTGDNQAIWVIPNNNGTSGTWTVTEAGSTGLMMIDVYEYSGMDLTGTLDGTAGSANSNVSASLTTSFSDSMIFVAGAEGASNTGGRTSTHSLAGFTQRLNNSAAGSSCSSCGGDAIGKPAGAYTDTITWAPSVGAGFCVTLIIGIRAAAVTPPPTYYLGNDDYY